MPENGQTTPKIQLKKMHRPPLPHTPSRDHPTRTTATCLPQVLGSCPGPWLVWGAGLR